MSLNRGTDMTGSSNSAEDTLQSNHSEAPILAVAIRPSNVLTVLNPFSNRKRSGAGLVLYKTIQIVGAAVDDNINHLYNKFFGPQKAGNAIESYFGDGVARETALDRCAKEEKAKKVVDEYCCKLLSYAKARSNSAETQSFTFKLIFTLVTRYPGIRPLFTSHPEHNSKKTTNNRDLWARQASDECDDNWQFYHDLAEYCLQKTKLSELIESEVPSKFSQLTPIKKDGPLTKERLEDLLSFCSSDANYDNEKICAIQYLAGILELPTFWSLRNQQNMDIKKRLFGFLSDLCDKIFRMLEDTMPDLIEPGRVSVHMLASRNAVDKLVCAVFQGLVLLCGKESCLPTLPLTLHKSVDLIKSCGPLRESNQIFARAYQSLPRIEAIIQVTFSADSESGSITDAEPTIGLNRRTEDPESFASLPDNDIAPMSIQRDRESDAVGGLLGEERSRMAHARYSFDGAGEGELPMSYGAEIEVLDDIDPGWWYARDVQTGQGVVPAAYVY